MAKEIIFKTSMTDDLGPAVDYLVRLMKPSTIFLFNGEMSAGKTTLISKILFHFGFTMVSSPTYAIHQVYNLNPMQIHHLDLHRLETTDQIESAGIWDLFENQNDIFFIEWANRIQMKDWPMGYLIVHIEIVKNQFDDSRILKIQTDED